MDDCLVFIIRVIKVVGFSIFMSLDWLLPMKTKVGLQFYILIFLSNKQQVGL